MYYTYVLLCRDFKRNRLKLYIGLSEDLQTRIAQHKRKEIVTTKSFDEIELIYYESCLSKTDARKRELQLKTGFGRGYLKRRLEDYFNKTKL